MLTAGQLYVVLMSLYDFFEKFSYIAWQHRDISIRHRNKNEKFTTENSKIDAFLLIDDNTPAFAVAHEY